MSARDERIRVLFASILAEGQAVFSISLRDLVLSADTRASVASERAIFCVGAKRGAFVLGHYLPACLSVGLSVAERTIIVQTRAVWV